MSGLRRVDPLDPKHHGTRDFRCGESILDRWLRAHAGQSQRRDLARTFVAADSELRVGYYTLVAGQNWQGRGVGSGLLRDAMRRTLAAAKQIGIRALLVEAIDDRAAVFYRRYGFEAVKADGLNLMVPLAAVRAQLDP